MGEDTVARTVRRRPRPAPGPAGSVGVTFVAGDQYRIAVRGHETGADQPVEAGGEDLAPTPVELFVGSLAACVGFYAGRFLARHGMSREGLEVRAEYEMADDRPARVAGVRMHVTVPPGMSGSQLKALYAVMSHCTVHNSLRQPPEVRISMD